MSVVILIAGRELQQTMLRSARAYVVTAAFLLLSGVYFYGWLVETHFTFTTISGFVEAARILVVVFAAILTMGLFAEERSNGTLELLLTAPVRDYEIVVGKFLGCIALYCGMLCLTLYYPLLLYAFGDPDLAPILTSYLGLVLLGGVCIAAGLFAASACRNQIASATLCLSLLFGLYYLGAAVQALPEAAGRILADLSLAPRFSAFTRGILDSADIVYYVTLAAVFLALASGNLARERWR